MTMVAKALYAWPYRRYSGHATSAYSCLPDSGSGCAACAGATLSSSPAAVIAAKRRMTVRSARTRGQQLRRSIESIAREAGKAASTVGYWVNKYGLSSRHAERHAPRGGIEREQLEALLAEGLSIRAMAERLAVSYTTVRHWLARHGLATPRGKRLAETAPARAAGAETTEAQCPLHGLT